MSWFSPILLTRNEQGASATYASLATETFYRVRDGSWPSGGLGSASASGQWTWTSAAALPAADVASATSVATRRSVREGSAVRAPVELLARMTEAARAQGRSESDVWVEAARDWLRRREGAPFAPPAPATVTAPSAAPRRTARLWDEIDALLCNLRTPSLPGCEGIPAA